MNIDKSFSLNLNLKGELKMFSKPLIMGILNITEDSFYKESCVFGPQQMLETAGKMLDEGADILDFGAQSTRPNSMPISQEEELERVLPMIELVVKSFPHTIISIDTYYSKVAEECIKAGVHIVNDISAGNMDKHILDIAAKYQTPYIAMHMQGTPQTMQSNPQYNDICKEVTQYLQTKSEQAINKGIKDVIVDFGFGFGKTIEHNYELLRNVGAMKQVLQKPVLIGVSRKSMLWKMLKSSPQEVLPATSALHLFALQQGADILRVHDVREAIQVRILWAEYLNTLNLPRQ
ncbi:MAG: dihydropteroate synthase [Bacteroidia bacterium]|nr:dihydropteroate synthase [Bacteroidia bacterium]